MQDTKDNSLLENNNHEHNHFENLENLGDKSLLNDLHNDLEDMNHLPNDDISSSPLAPHDYFCKECRKIVTDKCDMELHDDYLIPY